MLKIPLHSQWPVAAAAICQAQSGCTAQTPWLWGQWGMAGFSQENTATAWRIQHRSQLVAMESPCISSGKFCCDTAVALTSQNNSFFLNLHHFLSLAKVKFCKMNPWLMKATPLCTQQLPIAVQGSPQHFRFYSIHPAKSYHCTKILSKGAYS